MGKRVTKILRWLAVLIILFVWLQPCPSLGKPTRKVEELLETLQSLRTERNYPSIIQMVQSLPKGIDKQAEIQMILGEAKFYTGDIEGAVGAFSFAEREPLLSKEALTWLLRVHLSRYDFKRAKATAKKLDAFPQLTSEALYTLGNFRLEIGDLEGASNYLSELLSTFPDSHEAYDLFGNYLLATRDLKQAEALYVSSLLQGPDYRARLGLASISFEESDFEGGRDQADSALKLNPFLPSAFESRGFAGFHLKDLPTATDDLRKAIQLNPYSVYAHSALGNGITLRPTSRTDLSEEGILAYVIASALNLEQKGERLEAIYLLESIAPLESYSVDLHNLLGSLYFLEGRDDDAARAFMIATLLDPLDPLANNGLSASLKRKLTKENVESKSWGDKVAALAVPEIPDVSRFIIGFESLPEDYRRVIILSIEPFKRFLPILIRNGATHYILPLHESLINKEEFKGLSSERVFDGRLYADLRGIGGKEAVTGIELLGSLQFGTFNTFAHEFAHQVHFLALEDEDRRVIDDLYRTAVEKGSALDYYAASNPAEYFAQGYEAFITAFKRSDQRLTAGHTRDELARKDPDLFEFILDLSVGRRKADEPYPKR